MTSNPLEPDIVDACAVGLYRTRSAGRHWDHLADSERAFYRHQSTACIRAFLANWRPEVSQAMLDAACTAYDECFRVDIEAIRGSMSAALKASLDTMLAEERAPTRSMAWSLCTSTSRHEPDCLIRTLGWTPDQLRTIADDIERREREREAKP